MSRSIPTEDRISTLPDQILCHILSFLPTKFAATTSVLSKRWKPLWLSVETLHFDDRAFETDATFRDFMSSVFLLRDIMLPLRSFQLKYSNQSSFYQRNISQLVHAAVQRREIENLNLDMPYSIWFQLKLPHSVFSCKTLVVLHLKGIKLNDLSHVVVDLPSLKSLHLSRKPIQRVDYLSKLLFGCPALEEFHAALNMRYLKLNGQFSMYHNLTDVGLILKNNHSKKWNWLLEVVKHCPKLQNLGIREEYSKYVNEVEDNWMNPTIVPECLSTQLKTCFLFGYKGTECDIQFAEYIMQNSKVLNTMLIKSASSLHIDVKLEMITKLASSTRASSTCKLLFVDHTYST